MKKRGLILVVMAALPVILFSGCAGSQKVEEVVFYDAAVLKGVTRLTDDGFGKGYARVSPDGTKMLYTEYRDGRWQIVLLRDVNVPAKTQLIDYATAPSWYEDNNKFLYVITENDNNKILRSSIGGGGKTYVTRNPVGSGDGNPTIRDGVILFNTQIDGKWQIFSMTDSGNEITMLGDGRSPSWHPTEAKFVFVRGGDVYEMDYETTQVTELFVDPKYYSYLPSYSGDGQYILFLKGTEQKAAVTKIEKKGKKQKKTTTVTGSTRNQIFVMKANGDNPQQLTSGNVDCLAPNWDKNNNIYFISNAMGRKYEIYRARISLD